MSFLDKAPRVKSCCFCITLPTGTKTISILEIIYWILKLVILILALIGIPAMIDFMQREAAKNGEVYTEEEISQIKVGLYAYAVIGLLFTIPGFIFAILLCVGAFQERPKFIKVWLWVELILICIYTPYTIYSLFNKGSNAGDIVLNILGIALRVYWWLSVNSHRIELERQQEFPYGGNVNVKLGEVERQQQAGGYPTLPVANAPPK